VLWRELGNLPMLADNLGSTASYSFFLGDIDKGFEVAAESLAISRSIGNYWAESVTLFTSGFFFLEQGDFQTGMANTHQATGLAGRSGFLGGVAFSGMSLASAQASLGAREQAYESARKAFDELPDSPWTRPFRLILRLQVALYSDLGSISDEEVQDIYAQLEKAELNRFLEFLFTVVGDFAFARGDYEQLLRLAEHMAEKKRKKNVLMGLPDMLYLKGLAYTGLGKPAEARTAFDEAREIAEKLGLRRSLWPILAKLAPLEAEAGNHEVAAKLWKQAREIVEHIGQNTGSDDLTTSFFSLPDVQAVLRA